jgi:Trk-type K+ transport system membrane component
LRRPVRSSLAREHTVIDRTDQLRDGRAPQAKRIRLPRRASQRASSHPTLVFVFGFACVIAVGALILTLPIASAAGQWTPLVDALFTAISAVCVTGLVVLDTGTYWSGFGQVVILALIQVGGFGLMTSSTLLLLLLRRQATMRERVLLRCSFGGLLIALALEPVGIAQPGAGRLVVFRLCF